MHTHSLLKCDVIYKEYLTKALSIHAGVRLSCFWLSSPQDCLQSIKQITERMSCPGTTLTVWKASCLEYANQECSSWPLNTLTFMTVTQATDIVDISMLPTSLERWSLPYSNVQYHLYCRGIWTHEEHVAWELETCRQTVFICIYTWDIYRYKDRDIEMDG